MPSPLAGFAKLLAAEVTSTPCTAASQAVTEGVVVLREEAHSGSLHLGHGESHHPGAVKSPDHLCPHSLHVA